MQLVFIHGSGGTGKVWAYQLQRFPDALAVTLPGHPEGSACESIEAATAWLRAELGGRQDLVLVGHSLGGAIALQYALDHPEELAGVVLVGSGARLRVHPATLGALEQMIDSPDAFPQMMEDTWKKVPGELAGKLMQQAIVLGPLPFLQDLRICDRFDIIERLSEIQLPILAIVGSEDVMTPPKYSEFLRDQMPDVAVEVVEGGTHYVFAEFADRVNDGIEGFIGRLSS
jgi:pimeloyl-ACP methyl ester carboxylesterase